MTTVAVGSQTTNSVWTVTIPNTKTSVGGVYIFTIDFIKNSFSEQATPYFTNPTTLVNELGYCGATSTTGTTIDSNVKLVLSTSKFTATSITSAVLSSASAVNGATTALSLSLTLTDAFTTAGEIVVSLPRQTSAYVGFGLATSSDSMIVGCSTSSCSPTLTISVTYGGAAVSVGSYSAAYGSTSDLITIKTSTAASLAAGGTLAISIASIYNPPSFQPLSFSVWTADSLGNKEDYQASTHLTTSTMGTFQTGGSITISSMALVTQSPATYSFYLINQNPIPTSSYLTIVLPSGVSVLTSSLSINCVLYCDSTNVAIAYTSSTSTIKITYIFDSSYIASGTPIKFDITGFVNPSVVGNYAFTITSWETTSGTAYAIDTINTLYVTPSPGVITITSILPTDSTKIYDVPSSYTVKLTSSIAMAVTNVLVIVFPSDFQVQSNTTCRLTGLHTGWSCIPYSTNNTIIMKTFLGSTLSANVQVPTFTVTCIKNPGIYTATGNIVVTQYTNTFGEMATGSTYIKANYFTYNSIESFTVATSNSNAGQYPTNYTFTVTPRAKVNQGAYLSLSLPSDIQMPSASQVSKYCGGTAMSGFNANSAGLYCSVSSSTYIIQVTQGFSVGASSGDPPNLVFTILYLKNPRSTQTTSPFNVTIYDSGNKLMYAWNFTTLPTVSMTGAATPNYLSFQRDTTQNGAYATYYWIIQNNNYYQNGDFIIIKAPSPVQFSVFSSCTGINNLKPALTCTVSSDLYTINITVATNLRRELSTGKIPGSSSISLNVSNVLNAPSYRPTTNSFTYNVYSSAGYQVESQSTGLNVTNTLPGILAYQTTGVSPANYNYNANVAYTVTFVPVNYEIGMYIYITVPSQLAFPTSQISCSSVIGIESSLSCLSDSSTRQIKITGGFANTRNNPSLVKFTLNTLTNPSNKLITGSFQIQTYTADAYKMDQLLTGLTINFVCTYPCKSCDINNNSYCYSCYTTDKDRYFYQSSCLATCPETTYADQTNVSCNNCTSPCLNCVNSSTTCLSCITGYTLNGTNCYKPTLSAVSTSKDNIINFFYPWPFVGCTFLMTIIVLICILCRKETKFRESIIALVAWPEFLSWIALAAYQYYEYGLTLFFVLVAGGLLVQMILNVSYGIAHQKRIIPLNTETYRNFIIDNHKCSVVTLMFSFLFTFKFHHIMLSFLGNGEHLKGEFNRPSWRVWNAIAIVSILFSYVPVAGSCVLYLLQTQLFGSVLYFLNIEVLVISSYVAILLLMGIFRTCCCTCGLGGERKKKEKGSREEKYNEVKNDSSSMIHEESTKKSKRSKMDELIDEEDIEISSTMIKRTNKRRNEFIYTQNVEEEDEYDEEQNRSKRHRETEPLTAENKQYERKYREEMEKLARMTEMLKNQQELHNFEKRLILQERERVLKEKDEKFKEIESMKIQLKEEKEEIKKERAKLVDQRDEFLEQVDKRVKQRIEDWEMQSMRSITTIAKKLKLTEDLNGIEQSIQTIKRMNEVSFNVDVGAENREQMNQRLLNPNEKVTQGEIIQKKYEQKTMGKIVEEEFDSDDINQILKKADEVLLQQQEGNGEIQSAIQAVLPAYGKENLSSKEIEGEPYLVLNNALKGVFEKSELDSRFNEKEPELYLERLPKAAYRKEEIIREDIIEGDESVFFNKVEAIFDRVDIGERRVEKEEELCFSMPQNEMEVLPGNQRELDASQQNFFFNDKAKFEKDENKNREIDKTQQNFFVMEKASYEKNESQNREIDKTQQNFFANEQPAFEHIGNNERTLDKSQQNFFSNEQPTFEYLGANERTIDKSQQNFFTNDKAQFEQLNGHEKELDASPQHYFTNDKPTFQKDENKNREIDKTQQNFFSNEKPAFEHLGVNERTIDKSQQNFFNNDKAQFEHLDKDSRELEKSHEVIEPLDNQPYFNKTGNNFNNGQQDENSIETTVKPEFENIAYDKENDEEMKTQYNDDLDEIKMNDDVKPPPHIEADDLDKHRDFAKKKKKVLYSDKSESSVDEMMEDTPSNYNIPNGRLDGKSMGIKSVLLYAKKQGLKLPINSPDLETKQIPNLLGQNRMANAPKLMQQDEERKFVNNLIRDDHGHIGLGGAKTIGKNLSVPRQNDRNHNNGFDSGNEASWRAFNQPIGKGVQIVAGNDTAQTIGDGQHHTIENNEDEMMGGGKKRKKKVVNAQKQFKEPPPNVERIKALESAYMGGGTGRQQEHSQGRPQHNKAVLPHRIGGGYVEGETDKRLMKNNFL